MIESIISFFHDNQFLSGGFLLMVSGAAMAMLRAVPARMWGWIKKRFILSVDVTNDDPIFEWLALWLANHPYSKRARMLTATTKRTEWGGFVSPDEREGIPVEKRVVFTPAPGNHLFIYNRRLVWLERSRKDLEKGAGGDGGFLARLNKETFNIRIIGRKQSVIRSLIEEAGRQAQQSAEKQVEVFISTQNYWDRLSTGKPRLISTVILPRGQKEALLEDIQDFLGRQDWYVQMGIPYRRGYLLHGVPGSGKTSLITSLAGEFKMNLYSLNLGAELSDDRLCSLLATVPPKSIILLEDIDCVFQGRERDKSVKEGVTFSGLLNALDGVGAKEGCLVFMTTNRKDVLDAALIRPGRADYHLQFDYSDSYQASEMFRRFYAEATPQECEAFGVYCAKHRQMSMADMQQHLLVNKDDKKSALGLAEVKQVAA